MIKRGKTTAKQFVTDARNLGRSVRTAVTGKPVSVSAADKAKAANMAGAGGLSGRRRDSARDAYIEDAVGTGKKK